MRELSQRNRRALATVPECMRLMPAVSVLLLAACAAPGTPAAQPASPSVAPSTKPVAPAAQAEVIDCGVQLIPQGQGLSEIAMACILDAAKNRRPARLEETRPTIEGDPIISRYLVRPDGTIEVTRDTTKDRFGNHGITKEICTGPAAGPGILTFDRCTPVP